MIDYLAAVSADTMRWRGSMSFLSLILLAGTAFISYPALSQTAPTQPSPSAMPSDSGATQPGSTTPTGGMAAETKPRRQVRVSTLTDKALKGLYDAELGEIERVVESSTDKKTYAVVSSGGFLGLFESEYLVPLDQVALSGDAVTTNLTRVQLESSAPFVDDSAKYRSLDDTQMVAVLEKR